MNIDLPITKYSDSDRPRVEIYKDKIYVPDWDPNLNYDTVTPITVLTSLSFLPFSINNNIIDDTVIDGIHKFEVAVDGGLKSIGESTPVKTSPDTISVQLSLYHNKPYCDNLVDGVFWPLRNLWNKYETDKGILFKAKTEYQLNVTGNYGYVNGGTPFQGSQIYNYKINVYSVKTPVAIDASVYYNKGEKPSTILENVVHGDEISISVSSATCEIFGDYVKNIPKIIAGDSNVIPLQASLQTGDALAIPKIYAMEDGLAREQDISTIPNVIENFFDIAFGDPTDPNATPDVYSLDIPGATRVIRYFDSNDNEIEDMANLPTQLAYFNISYTIYDLNIFAAVANNKSLKLRAYDPTMGYEQPPENVSSIANTQLYEDVVVLNKLTTGESIGYFTEVWEDGTDPLTVSFNGASLTAITDAEIEDIEESQNGATGADIIFKYFPNAEEKAFSFGLMSTLEGYDLEDHAEGAFKEAKVFVGQSHDELVGVTPVNSTNFNPIELTTMYPVTDYLQGPVGEKYVYIGIRLVYRAFWNGEAKLKIYAKGEGGALVSGLSRTFKINSAESTVMEI